ncbi:MAG TPA: NifU family protein [Streptosporangiaceae bacterium]|nr:NifU family protein [Streptosporangiaceae bacterium]
MTASHDTPSPGSSPRDTGTRIEELLDGLRERAGPGVAAAAEELVRLLVGTYGEALGRIVAVLRESGPAGTELLGKLAGDPAVEGLLLVHDLHPLDVDARIERALDRVRPYLGSHAGGVTYLGTSGGVARLRLQGSCHGCPSSMVTVQLAITDAVRDAAPEVSDVAVEGVSERPPLPLLQIGRGPGATGTSAQPTSAGATGAGPADADDVNATWVSLPEVGPPSSRPVSASAGGLAVLVCSVRGTLYAYRDVCAACGSSLADGTLDRENLTCPGCGTHYDVRLAGRSKDSPDLHLDPLPLLADSQGVRVAVPEAART